MWAQGSLADRVHRGRPSKGEAWDRPLPSETDRLAAGGREAEAGPQLHMVEDDLLIEDIEEFDLDGDDDGDGDAGNGDLQQPPGRLPLPPCGTGCPVAVAGRRLAAADARALCMLLFKHAGGEPPESWWQGFFFSQHPELPFGLVQDAGGPCGVLAAVQAHLLVVQYRVGRGFDLQLDSQQRQRQALTRAVAAAVWGARAGRSGAVWVTCSSAFGDCSGMPFRALADSLSVRDAASLSELERCVADSLPQLTARRGAGLLLLLLSVLLTRGGCDAVAADMDEPEAGLTAAHGYATLDLVNLLISGEAVSNVFDGDMELDGTVMKGVRHRGRIGMLTLFEWYRSLEVGERLKSPQLPVWLVCSESHFSVLWADDPAAALGVLPCDLHYYDGLAKQSAPIRLTLSPGDRPRSHAEFNNDQLLPPLEAVLLTKWHGAEVDWNGTEPLL